MAEILISEAMEEASVRLMVERFDTRYDTTLFDRPADLRREIALCRAIIVRNRTLLTAELLGHAARLEVIGRLGVGLDNIDLEACRARAITVIPATGANADAVAEYVIGAMFVLLRGVYHATAKVLGGAWLRNQMIGREVMGKRLGLIGFGESARSVARRAPALGMTAVAHAPTRKPDDPIWARFGVPWWPLDRLLAESDVVSLHLPLKDNTRNLLSAERLGWMKPRAVLINTARGGIVDEAALAAALREGRLAGAAMDVYADEPLPPGGILVGVPNLIATPHIAGVTDEANLRVSGMITDRVLSYLESNPVRVPA